MRKRRVKIGIVGCGAIGSRIAKSIFSDLTALCQLTGLYDIDQKKSKKLSDHFGLKRCYRCSLNDLITHCDIVVEAVNAKNTKQIIRQALQAGKNVLAMSVGKLLNASNLFTLAQNKHCSLLLPSGAIAGLDAIKAASLVNIQKIKLTTRKSPLGFQHNPYLKKKGIDISKIKKETTLFKGNVQTAVKLFPQNINVAATLALAAKAKQKLLIEIIASPRYTMNSHEIEVSGDFGRIRTRTDNVVCPDNPKTSYLAVLSGIQTLKQFCSGILIGT